MFFPFLFKHDYASTVILTKKVNIYSFGVVMLEAMWKNAYSIRTCQSKKCRHPHCWLGMIVANSSKHYNIVNGKLGNSLKVFLIAQVRPSFKQGMIQ